MIRVVVICMFAGGCVQSSSVACGALTCSSSAVCAPGDRCVSQSQLDACSGLADEATCNAPGIGIGVCDRSVCVTAGCGNSVIEPNFEELCDDGNRLPLDGCSADCKSLEQCGDGVADSLVNEECDDGPANSNEPGAVCRTGALACTHARCGDGIRDPSELCDDGNNVAGDGCRADCAGRWTVMSSGTYASLAGVWGSAPDNVYAVGERRILHYDGASWSSTATSTASTQVYKAIWGSGPNNIFAASLLQIDRFNGTTWSTIPGSAGEWYAVWGTAANDVWFGGRVAANNVLWHWNGSTFDVKPMVNGPASSIWGTASNNVYAATAAGLHRYNGTSWTNIVPSPAYTVYGTAANDVYASFVGQLQHFNGTSWSIVPGGDLVSEAYGFGGVATDLVATSVDGRVQVFDGTTWATSMTPTTFDLLSVWIYQPKRGFIVGYNGTILY